MKRILSLNLGSTSTKAAVFHDTELVDEITIRHSSEEIGSFKSVYDQFDFRKKAISDWLISAGYGLEQFDAVAARGGLTKKIPGGVWQINETMLRDLTSGEYGTHVCNLCARLAYELFGVNGIPCFVVDTPVTDELDPIARISGTAGIERECTTHALNQRASAKKAAALLSISYENGSFIVAHMGGGITVGAHKNGRIIDSSDGVNGEGPFTPERSGGLPVRLVIRDCYSGRYSEEEMQKRLTGGGGMVSYTGLSDMRELERLAKEDKRTELLIDAMAYQVAKAIGSMSAVLSGKVDGIVLTGGLAHSESFTKKIKERVESIAPVFIFPGEDENRALAEGALLAINGEAEIRQYA